MSPQDSTPTIEPTRLRASITGRTVITAYPPPANTNSMVNAAPLVPLLCNAVKARYDGKATQAAVVIGFKGREHELTQIMEGKRTRISLRTADLICDRILGLALANVIPEAPRRKQRNPTPAIPTLTRASGANA